jgi:sulfite exporter TauE/SafE
MVTLVPCSMFYAAQKHVLRVGSWRGKVPLMRFGLGVPLSRRTFTGNGSGASRGDRNRNARLERQLVPVPVTNAIAGIDLAGALSAPSRPRTRGGMIGSRRRSS